jgi:hypothetical protein
MANLWALIRLILELIGLWKYFASERAEAKVAEREERRQDRDKAVDVQQNAQTEEEFDRAQEEISRNLPRP